MKYREQKVLCGSHSEAIRNLAAYGASNRATAGLEPEDIP